MKLAQEYDSMFERNVAIIASRKQEVFVHVDGQDFVGYICGLDDQWLQIYGHEAMYSNDPEFRFRFCLINRDNVSSITSRGRDVKALEGKDKEFVEKKIYNFSNVSREFLEEVRRSNENDGTY